jgi:hypothetical protein
MRIEAQRTYKPHATYSDATVYNEKNEAVFSYKILELPWKENKRRISCIPEGEYVVMKMLPAPKRPYVYFYIKNVPNRDSILMHPGNFTSQILGCQLPGERFVDLNKDGLPDIANTTATLKKLADLLPDKFILKITKKIDL